MPINNINNVYSGLAKAVNHINNPNLPTGVLLEEIPADVGRSYEGYKRGGILEGAEKLRKEVMSAAVWIAGIPFFQKLNELFFEHVLKIPMAIDYSSSKDVGKTQIKEGNDSIKSSVEYLVSTSKEKFKNFDTSELKKYGSKFEGMDINTLTKRVKGAKQFSILSALALNCAMMGIVIPKVNQAMTAKKIKEMNSKNSTLKTPSLDEFADKRKNNKDVSFKGLNFANAIDFATYSIENSNRARLISTDVPMIMGRCATSRNPYEALEFFVIDGASIYLYNFLAPHLQKLMRGKSTPVMDLKGSEAIINSGANHVKEILDNLGNEPKDLYTLLRDDNLAETVYKHSTHDRYGKINKFMKKSELDEINSNVYDYLKKIKETINYDGKNLNFDDFVKTAKKYNKKNALFLGISLMAAAFSLGIVMPKIAYKITQILTGRNEFTGIADYSKDNNKKA